MSGSIFKNYIVSEIYKKELSKNTHTNLYYLRTSNQNEVDLIIDRKSYREFIEIKSGKTFKLKMVQTIEKFLEPNDKGYLLYNGVEFPYKKNIEILNYKDYLKS